VGVPHAFGSAGKSAFGGGLVPIGRTVSAAVGLFGHRSRAHKRHIQRGHAHKLWTSNVPGMCIANNGLPVGQPMTIQLGTLPATRDRIHRPDAPLHKADLPIDTNLNQAMMVLPVGNITLGFITGVGAWVGAPGKESRGAWAGMKMTGRALVATPV